MRLQVARAALCAALHASRSSQMHPRSRCSVPRSRRLPTVSSEAELCQQGGYWLVLLALQTTHQRQAGEVALRCQHGGRLRLQHGG